MELAALLISVCALTGFFMCVGVWVKETNRMENTIDKLQRQITDMKCELEEMKKREQFSQHHE